MKVLQVASTNMEFFQEQVRILEEIGVTCDVIYSGNRHTEYHTDESGPGAWLLNKLYGHNLAYYLLRGGMFYPKVLRKSIFQEYDVVHVNSGMAAPMAVLQPERPLVTTLWGDDLLGNRLKGYQSTITKHCAMRSDAVIVRSEEMNDELPCDAHVIPSGVDMDKFAPIPQGEAQQRVGWDSDELHVMFPYHPSQTKKRYPVAEEMVSNVRSDIDAPVNLQIVTGVPHEEMPTYFSAADAMVLPSLREGSPNTVKEAMACNLPVISTDVGDVSTRLAAVEHSSACGSTDEMEDALRETLQAGERSNGREHVSDVSLEAMGEELVSIYENLTDQV